MTKTSGDISTYKQEYKWVIPNFQFSRKDVDYSLFSPSFTFDEATWSMRVYPNGRSDRNEGQLYLALQRQSPMERKQKVTYTMGVYKSNGHVYEHFGEECTFEEGQLEHGKPLNLSRSTMELDSGPEGKITVFISIAMVEKTPLKIKQLQLS